MKDGYLTGDGLLFIGIVAGLVFGNWWLVGIVVALDVLKWFE